MECFKTVGRFICLVDTKKEGAAMVFSRVKFNLVLFTAYIVIWVLGTYLSVIRFLGAGGFIWGGIFCVIWALFLIMLYYRFKSKVSKSIGAEKKLHTNGHAILQGMLTMFMIFISIPLTHMFIIEEAKDGKIAFSIFVLVLLIMAILIFIIPIFYKRENNLSEGFTVIYFTETGVHGKGISGDEYFLPWNECVDIGWTFVAARGAYFYMYFSTRKLTEKEIKNIRTVRHSEQTLHVQHSAGLQDEVLQYIDKERIAGFGCVDEKGRSTRR